MFFSATWHFPQSKYTRKLAVRQGDESVPEWEISCVHAALASLYSFPPLLFRSYSQPISFCMSQWDQSVSKVLFQIQWSEICLTRCLFAINDFLEHACCLVQILPHWLIPGKMEMGFYTVAVKAKSFFKMGCF